jgi:hypothetical protein
VGVANEDFGGSKDGGQGRGNGKEEEKMYFKIKGVTSGGCYLPDPLRKPVTPARKK